LAYGLYIHYPFCIHKCGYCDFNSWKSKSDQEPLSWFLGIKKQIDFWSTYAQTQEIIFDTIFIGGGTPSLMPEDLFKELSAYLFEKLKFKENFEFTIECNPETINTKNILQVFRSCGVNRLSIGIQSFDNTKLVKLERHADKNQNIKALDLVSSFGYFNWSADLMFGLPKQDKSQLVDDLDELLKFKPNHISIYELTLSTQRSLNWSKPNDDTILQFYSLIENYLLSNGLNRYEISNFSKPGFECQHNLKYWNLDPYLSLGPGGYGLIYNNCDFGFHQKNPSSLKKWIVECGNSNSELGSFLEQRTQLEHIKEKLMVNLRLNKGLEVEFYLKYKSLIDPIFDSFKDMEILVFTGKTWRMNRHGWLTINATLQEMFYLLEKKYPSYNLGGLTIKNMNPN